MVSSARLTGLLAVLVAATGAAAAASIANLDLASWRATLLIALGAASGILGARTD